MSEQPDTTRGIDSALVQRQLRRRNLAVMAVLLGFVGLFFALTIIKLAPNNQHAPPAAQGIHP